MSYGKKRIGTLILFLGLTFFCSLAIAQNNASAIELKTGTIYRKNATEMSLNFRSDTAGEYYYQVTSYADVPVNIQTTGVHGGAVSANTLSTLNLTTLTSGKQYIHLLVTDGTNQDIKTVAVPYDFYFYEDYEIYDIDAYPSFFTSKYSGTGLANQKVISAAQSDTSTGQVFFLEGASGWASDQRLIIGATNALVNDMAYLEVDMKAITDYPGSIGMGQEGDRSVVGWTGGVARITLANSKLYHAKGDDTETETNSSKSYNKDEWMHIKIVVDYTNKKFSYYINDVRINDDYLDTHPTFYIDYIGISAGNSEYRNRVYYDNLKVYNTTGSIIEHDIAISAVEHGAITTNKTKSNMDNIITITDTPEEGYQLKTIKIQKTLDNSDITELVNYDATNQTFIMPDYPVTVIPEFELVPAAPAAGVNSQAGPLISDRFSGLDVCAYRCVCGYCCDFVLQRLSF